MIFISQIGYYFFYTLALQQVRREAKEQLFANITESSLESIVLENSCNAITWEDDGKEFYLDGELYDVVKTEVKEGKTILRCINDKKEQLLLNEFAKALRSRNDHNTGGKSGKHAIKFQLTEFTAFILQSESFFNNAKQQFIAYDAAIVSANRTIISPPPKA